MMETYSEVKQLGQTVMPDTLLGRPCEATSSVSLLREIADLIQYHERMVSLAAGPDDVLLKFLLPPKFADWLLRYREALSAGVALRETAIDSGFGEPDPGMTWQGCHASGHGGHD